MNLLLLAAGVLAFITGILHSVLGERFIVGRLMIVEIGRTSERRGFVRHVIRFAWHLTTVFLFGFAALLLNMAAGLHALLSAKALVGWTFAAGSILALVSTRGKHFSWIVFALIALLAFAG